MSSRGSRQLRDLRVKLRVVLPSGNSYLARIHAQLSFAAGPPTRNLQWRVQPDDRTPSFLEIWLPSPCPDPLNSRITLTVTSPTGASMTTWENGPPVTIAMAGVDYAWAYWIPWPLSDRARFIVIVEATAQPDDFELAILHLERALRLSPRDARAYVFYQGMAFALLLSGNAKTAREWALRGVQHNANYAAGWWVLAASSAALGNKAEAEKAVQHILALDPAFSISGFVEKYPTGRPSVLQPLVQGLRMAGVPE